MQEMTELIGEELNDFSVCVEVGNGAFSSFFMNFEKQAESGCENLLKIDEFRNAEEINVIGLS